MDEQGSQVAEIAVVTDRIGDCLAAEIVLKNRTIEVLNSQLAYERQYEEQKYACLTKELDLKNSRIKEVQELLKKKTYDCDVQEQKTKLTDQAEQRLGLKTQKINELEQLVNELEDDNQKFREMHASHDAELKAVTEQLDEAKKHVEELRAMQWYVRAVKRQRIATMEDGGADE
jgi:hypothetical protein